MISDFALGILTATCIALALTTLISVIVLGWIWSWAARFKKLNAERMEGHVYLHGTLKEDSPRPGPGGPQ